MTWFRNRHILQQIALIYGVILTGAAALNYVPGVQDENGLCFGVFALDPFDDLLHVASALWAFSAGWISIRAARLFLTIFGALYLGDGAVGFLTAYGYLDLGIFRYTLEAIDLSVQRVLANLPHIALGGYALWAGVFLARRDK